MIRNPKKNKWIHRDDQMNIFKFDFIDEVAYFFWSSAKMAPFRLRSQI